MKNHASMTSEQREKYRNYCEAKYVLSKPKSWRINYLNGVKEKRGDAACEYLKAEIMRQYRAASNATL